MQNDKINAEKEEFFTDLGLDSVQTAAVSKILSDVREEAEAQYQKPDPKKEEFLVIGVNEDRISEELTGVGLTKDQIGKVVQKVRNVARGIVREHLDKDN